MKNDNVCCETCLIIKTDPMSYFIGLAVPGLFFSFDSLSMATEILIPAMKFILMSKNFKYVLVRIEYTNYNIKLHQIFFKLKLILWKIKGLYSNKFNKILCDVRQALRTIKYHTKCNSKCV